MTIVITKILGGFVASWLLGYGVGYAFRVFASIYDAIFHDKEF